MLQIIAFMYLSLMADNILLPFESLCAGVTGKEPLITVDMLFMNLQVAAVGERLHAGLAAIDDICFHSMVCTDVLQVASLIVEGPLALVTLELGFGCSVGCRLGLSLLLLPQ